MCVISFLEKKKKDEKGKFLNTNGECVQQDTSAGGKSRTRGFYNVTNEVLPRQVDSRDLLHFPSLSLSLSVVTGESCRRKTDRHLHNLISLLSDLILHLFARYKLILRFVSVVRITAATRM